MGDRGEVKPVESVLQMAVLGVGCRVKLGSGILHKLRKGSGDVHPNGDVDSLID